MGGIVVGAQAVHEAMGDYSVLRGTTYSLTMMVGSLQVGTSWYTT